MSALLERLWWASARDEDHLTKEDARANFVESVVDDPLFQRLNRLNELTLSSTK